MAGSLSAEQRRAAIRGGGGPDQGKCTIEVVVDGAAEVEIRGDTANLRNLSGRPPQWRRFECTGVMPRNVTNFRFSGVDGRGRQELVRDPRDGGVAVVRIEDPDNGSEGYTFDIEWNNRGGYPSGGPVGGRFSVDQAVRVCQDAIRQQAAERLRASNIVFRRTAIDDNPGRNDWVVGTFEVRRGYDRDEVYRFSCSVNFENGRVRSADIEPREGDRYPGNNAGGTDRAIQNCQRAVDERMRRDGYDRIEIGTIRVDDRPGRNDWIVGDVRGQGRYGRPESFSFSCSVDLRDGDVRSVDVARR